MRPTTPQPNVELVDDQVAADDAEQARGDVAPPAEPRTPKPRRKRPPAGGETKGRKLQLPDGVHERLQLLAIQRKTTASAIAAEILDRNLPRLSIVREG